MGESDDPVQNRRIRATERKNDLGTRCRTVSGAVIAVVWGVLGESRFPGLLDGLSRRLLIVAAGLAVIALFLDYAQTLFEYLDARFLTGKFLAPGGLFMFIAKQIVTCCAAVILLFGVGRMLTVPTKAAAQSDSWSIWVGSVTDDAKPNKSKSSTLYLRESDPSTGSTDAKKDNLNCTGSLQGNELRLNCGQPQTLQMDGPIIQDKEYSGTWINTDPQRSGSFDYKYSKPADPPASAH
jgi:hypothetical protein